MGPPFVQVRFVAVLLEDFNLKGLHCIHRDVVGSRIAGGKKLSRPDAVAARKKVGTVKCAGFFGWRMYLLPRSDFARSRRMCESISISAGNCTNHASWGQKKA